MKTLPILPLSFFESRVTRAGETRRRISEVRP
jgi:hypothetical protein